MSCLITCDHLSFGYRPGREVLHNLSFTLQPGLSALPGANDPGFLRDHGSIDAAFTALRTGGTP